MSLVEVCEILDVKPHPNADRMEILQIKGWEVCSAIGNFQKGDKCYYFPPETMVPFEDAERLEVSKYLKKVDVGGVKYAKVGVAKLRGFPSYGMALPVCCECEIGDDCSEKFKALKYNPPIKSNQGDAEKDNEHFHVYYKMDNLKNCPDLFSPEDEVAICEKIHGCSVRAGLIQEDGVWKFVTGSHRVRRKPFIITERGFAADKLKMGAEVGDTIEIDGSLYFLKEKTKYGFRGVLVDTQGRPIIEVGSYNGFLTTKVKQLLTYLSGCGYFNPEFQPVGAGKNVVIFGEMYGAGVQKGYCYGRIDYSFRAFDVSVNGKYLDFELKDYLFQRYRVPMVPVLYKGKFLQSIVDELTDDVSAIKEGVVEDDSVKVGREGVVITSMKEPPFGRKQAKNVSFNYLSR